MKGLAVIGRNAAQLFFCFAGSALLNVVCQAFFARTAGDDKDAWLSGTLLVGTLASLAGVPAAQRFGLPGRALLAGSVLVVIAGALFGATLLLQSAVAFTAVVIALRFFLQYGTQELDRRAVQLSGADTRRTNDAVGLAMRFLGMLLGPLWFGLAHDAHVATAVMIVVMTGLGLWTVALTAQAPSAPTVTRETGSLDRAGQTMLAAARVIYAAYYLLASSIIYVLSDLHHVEHAVRSGGLVVTLVYLSAIVATVVELARRRTTPRSPLEMVPAPALMVLVGVALPLAAAGTLPAQVGGGVLLGIAFARYQLAFRDRATSEAVHRGAPALLAAYNNLGTTSALLGYAVMAALVAGCRALGVSYASAVGFGVAGLGLLALPLVLASARLQGETSSVERPAPASSPGATGS